MSQDEYKKYYNFIIEIVHEAGQMVIDAYNAPKKVEVKDSWSLVTDADKKVEEFIVGKIQQQFPEHLIVAEENTPSGTTPTLTDNPTWIIDPIDGTNNFINNIPMIAISVALAIKREVVVGIVFNPIINHFYSAIKNGGAYCNGKKIISSKNPDLHKSIISNELSLAIIPFLKERTMERVNKLAEYGVLGFRCFGSIALALCNVAEGSSGVYYTDGVKIWDVAAGVLILQEAGGCVSGPDGREFDLLSRLLLAAGNQDLQKKMVEILSDCDKRTHETFIKLLPERFKSSLM